MPQKGPLCSHTPGKLVFPSLSLQKDCSFKFLDQVETMMKTVVKFCLLASILLVNSIHGTASTLSFDFGNSINIEDVILGGSTLDQDLFSYQQVLELKPHQNDTVLPEKYRAMNEALQKLNEGKSADLGFNFDNELIPAVIVRLVRKVERAVSDYKWAGAWQLAEVMQEKLASICEKHIEETMKWLIDQSYNVTFGYDYLHSGPEQYKNQMLQGTFKAYFAVAKPMQILHFYQSKIHTYLSQPACDNDLKVAVENAFLTALKAIDRLFDFKVNKETLLAGFKGINGLLPEDKRISADADMKTFDDCLNGSRKNCSKSLIDALTQGSEPTAKAFLKGDAAVVALQARLSDSKISQAHKESCVKVLKGISNQMQKFYQEVQTSLLPLISGTGQLVTNSILPCVLDLPHLTRREILRRAGRFEAAMIILSSTPINLQPLTTRLANQKFNENCITNYTIFSELKTKNENVYYIEVYKGAMEVLFRQGIWLNDSSHERAIPLDLVKLAQEIFPDGSDEKVLVLLQNITRKAYGSNGSRTALTTARATLRDVHEHFDLENKKRSFTVIRQAAFRQPIFYASFQDAISNKEIFKKIRLAVKTFNSLRAAPAVFTPSDQDLKTLGIEDSDVNERNDASGFVRVVLPKLSNDIEVFLGPYAAYKVALYMSDMGCSINSLGEYKIVEDYLADLVNLNIDRPL